MTESALPAFPYGAVNFRSSNPPNADWARDYATAAEDGMNIFRHWFLWVANPTWQNRPIRLYLSDSWGPYQACQTHWGAAAAIEGSVVSLIAPARDVSVLALD